MRSEPEIRELRAFVAVVDAAGFTRAAGLLGVSQSTVSEAVQGLERVLGADLFGKGRRRAALTPAGERLLPAARRVLAELDGAVREVVEADAAARATVAVGTSESISAYVLPGVLAEARREWPGTRYVVTADACPAIRRGVREGRLDLGLTLGAAGEGEGIHAERLAEGRLSVFALPGHPLAGAPAGVDDLAAHPLILSDAAGDFHALVARYVEGSGAPARRLLSAGTVEGVKRGVQADGEALGLLPAYAVADDLARGAFAEVRLRVPLPTVWLHAVWPRGTALPARAVALTERLRGGGLGVNP